MAKFSYSALKADGSVARGELEAADRGDAFRRLGRNGLQPVSLEVKSDGGGGGTATTTATAPDPSKNGGKKPATGKKKPAAAAREKKKKDRRKEKEAAAAGAQVVPTGPVRLKRAQVVLFTEELSDLLGAGLQLEPALRIMESRDEVSNLKTVAATVRQQVRDGASFSSSLRNSSPSFGDLYCNLAAAGEVSGALPTILKRQAEYLVKLQDLQNKVIIALIYPICLLVAVIAVSFLFVSFLMPELVSMLDDMGRKLPLPALILMGVSDFLKSFWWLIILFVIGGVTVFRKVVSSPQYEEKWHRTKLHLPFFGPMLSRRFFVQVLETLSNLVGNGLPLLKALELTRDATVNLYGRGLLDRIIDAVGEGASLSRTMRKIGFFPPILSDIVAVGEQTGDIGTALDRAATRYDKELEKAIQRLTALMQPVILIILASVVGPMAYIMIRVILESITGLR